jgi:hypothetical protein
LLGCSQAVNNTNTSSTKADVYEITTMGVIAKDYPYKVIDYEPLEKLLSNASGYGPIEGKNDNPTYSIKVRNGTQFTDIRIYENGKVDIEQNLMSSGDKYLTQNQYVELKKILGEPRISSPNK